MGSCFCTGICRETGRCPNADTSVPWRPMPWPSHPFVPPQPSPSPFPVAPPQRDVHIHTGISEERVREIIREELEKIVEQLEDRG